LFKSLNSLPILLILIILISPYITLNIAKVETSDQYPYYAHEQWRTVLHNTTSAQVVVYEDVNNDGFKDIFVLIKESSLKYRITILSGYNGSVIGSIIIVGNITGLRVVKDLNNNNYNETVISVLYVDEASQKSNVMFLVWDPWINSVLHTRSVVIDKPLSFSEFSVYNGVVEDTKFETVYTHIEQSYFSFSLQSYIVSYDFVSNTIEYSVEDNVLYTIYTDTLPGDVDNDGLLELTKEYKVIAYMSLQGFSTASTLKVYSGNNLLFTKTKDNRIYGLAMLTYNGNEKIMLMVEVSISFTGQMTLYIDGYRLTGDQVYEINLDQYDVNGLSLIGDQIVLFYNQSDTICLDVFSTITGGRLVHKDITYLEPHPSSSAGLGDIDHDGVKEIILYTSNGSRIIKVSNAIETREVVGMNIDETYNMLSVLDTNGPPLLITTKVDGNDTVIRALIISTGDDTPPEITITYPPRDYALTPPSFEFNALVKDVESGVDRVEAYIIDVENGFSMNITDNLTINPIDNYTLLIRGFVNLVNSGTYNLTIIAWNNAGLTSNAARVFIVDADKPVITIYSPLENKSYHMEDLPIEINFTVYDDNLAGWTVYLNNNPLASDNKTGLHQFNVTREHLREGVNNLTIIATDLVGNSDVKTVIFYFYSGPYVFNIHVLNENELDGYLEGRIRLNISLEGYCDVNIEYYKVIVDSYEYSVWIEFNNITLIDIDISRIPDGIYDLKIIVKPEGYDKIELYSRRIMIDNNPPTLDVNIPSLIDGVIDVNKAYVKDNTLTLWLYYTVSDVFLDYYEIYVDGAFYSKDYPVINNISLTEMITLDEGYHNITIIAFDKAGHNTSVSFKILVDLTPPTINEFKVSVSDNNITINYRVSDTQSGVKYVVVEITNSRSYIYNYPDTGKAFTITDIEPGNYTVKLIVLDKAGLTNTMVKNITIGYIKTPIPSTTESPIITPTPSTPFTTTTSPQPTPSTTQMPTVTGGGEYASMIILIAIIVIIVVAIAILMLRRSRFSPAQ